MPATHIDMATVDSGLQGFRGGVSNGKYLYLAPGDNDSYHGKVPRIELTNTGGFAVDTFIDLETLHADCIAFGGAATDGRYVYMIPDWRKLLVRIDTQDFSIPSASYLDLGLTDARTGGYNDSFIHNGWLYLIPFGFDAPTSYDGLLVRVNLANFSTVETLDLELEDAEFLAFKSATSDGKFGYLATNRAGATTNEYHIIKIDLETFTYVEKLTTPTDIPGDRGYVAIANDGRYLYALTKYPPKLIQIDLQTFTFKRLIVLGDIDVNLNTVDSISIDHRMMVLAANYSGMVAQFTLPKFVD